MTNETYTTKTEHTETDNNLTQQAKQAADRTKQQAQAAAEHAKASAKAGAHQAAHEASKMANELGAEAKQMAADATHEAEVRVNEQKGYAADRLSGVAHALRATGENFRNEDEGAFANYADSAADQVDRFAGYLRDQNVNDLARDVQQLAKRQPELFVAGALAAGFFLGRFFKSSEQRQLTRNSGDYQGNYNRDDANGQYRNAGAANPYGAPRYGESTYRAEPYRQPYGSQYGRATTQYEDRWDDRYSHESGNTQQSPRSYSSSYGATPLTGSAATSQPAHQTAEPQAYVAGSKVTQEQAEQTEGENK